MRQTSTRTVYENAWMRVREDALVRDDGSPGLYGVVMKDDCALVVPREGDGFWMVEQFRYTVGRRAWEFPQGGWPAGSGGTLAELAVAELAEETGLTAATWRSLGRINAAYGYSDQACEVFEATGLTRGAPHREDTEQDMVHRFVHRDELAAMVRDGRLTDGVTLAALSLLRLADGLPL